MPENAKKYEINTERLFLTPVRAGDAGYFFTTWNDREFRRFLFDDKYVSTEMVAGQIERSRSCFAKYGFGLWKLQLSGSQTAIGFCGLRPAPDLPGETGLLYGIEREYWGRGFAREAAAAVLGYGFEKLRIDKIVALANPENTASWKILERLGMKFVREIETDIEMLKVYEMKKQHFLTH